MTSSSPSLTLAGLPDHRPDIFPALTARPRAASIRCSSLAVQMPRWARELMSQPAITVSPDDTVRHAARLMYDRRVKRLPVVDSADRLAGIVSRTDVLTVYSRPDQEICRQITGDLLLRDFLTDPLSYRVTVQEGIVTLAGEPETAAVGHEIVRAVRHIEGVVAVRDRLEYPETDRHTYGPLF